MCAEAAFGFPEFAGARATAARILSQDGGQRLCEALAQTLQRPLVYGGDETMPFLRDLPPTDANWAAEMLSAQQEFADTSDDPLWTLVLRDDPNLIAVPQVYASDVCGPNDPDCALSIQHRF